MVARVVPNALDVRPRSAPLNALGTTRSATIEARSARAFGRTLRTSSSSERSAARGNERLGQLCRRYFVTTLRKVYLLLRIGLPDVRLLRAEPAFSARSALKALRYETGLMGVEDMLVERDFGFDRR